MGESYLKKKFFNTVKRIQRSQSLMGSFLNINSTTTTTNEQNNNNNFIERERYRNEENVNLAEQSQQDEEIVDKSFKRGEEQEELMTAIELIRSEPAVEMDYDNNDNNRPDEINLHLSSDNNNNDLQIKRKQQQQQDSLDEIENLQEEEEAAAIDDDINKINNKNLIERSKSKLKSASRAILFFRRAATVLKNSTSSNSFSTASPTLFENHLNGLPFQKQNTTGDYSLSTQSQNSSSQPSMGININNNNNSLIGSGKYNADNGYENKQPCKFIVPKLNSLKMPLVCLIKSLDGELMREVFVHRYELGQHLIENLKVSLGLEDCKFFGLKLAKSLDDQEDLRNPWLDLNESVCKQIKQFSGKGCILFGINNGHNNNNNSNNNNQPSSLRSIDFYLRIKYYPPNLTRVQDLFLRHYLWLQLRRDLSLGKLISSMNNLTLLMACILQYEFGDYNELFNLEKIQSLNILPNQDLIEEQAIELWRTKFFGCRKHQAQIKFLRAAIILETYGFDYYPVRDHQRQRAYLLGFNYAGIKTIRNGRIVHHLRWHSLSKICYERRMIIFHQYPTENSKRKQILGFKCLSVEDCQNLYMRLLEQKYFFTVDLAYFDKSVRRPSCLYSNRSIIDGITNNNNNQATENNNNNNNNNNEIYPQQDLQSPLMTQQHNYEQGQPDNLNGQQFQAQSSTPNEINNFTTNNEINNLNHHYETNNHDESRRIENHHLSTSTTDDIDLSDDDFINNACLRYRLNNSQQQDRLFQRSATQNYSLDSYNNNNNINNTLPKGLSCQDWTRKVFRSCQESGFTGLVESVLSSSSVAAAATSPLLSNKKGINFQLQNQNHVLNCNNNNSDLYNNSNQKKKQEERNSFSSSSSMEIDGNVFRQLFKFCLLILIMNILFHLCDNLSTILIDILTYSTKRGPLKESKNS